MAHAREQLLTEHAVVRPPSQRQGVCLIALGRRPAARQIQWSAYMSFRERPPNSRSGPTVRATSANSLTDVTAQMLDGPEAPAPVSQEQQDPVAVREEAS